VEFSFTSRNDVAQQLLPCQFILIQRNQNHQAFPQLHGCSFVEKHSQRNLQRNDLIVDDIRENYAFAMIETNFVQTSFASSDSSNQRI